MLIADEIKQSLSLLLQNIEQMESILSHDPARIMKFRKHVISLISQLSTAANKSNQKEIISEIYYLDNNGFPELKQFMRQLRKEIPWFGGLVNAPDGGDEPLSHSINYFVSELVRQLDGTNKALINIQTNGGTYINGNVSTSGGNFVGRDAWRGSGEEVSITTYPYLKTRSKVYAGEAFWVKVGLSRVVSENERVENDLEIISHCTGSVFMQLKQVVKTLIVHLSVFDFNVLTPLQHEIIFTKATSDSNEARFLLIPVAKNLPYYQSKIKATIYDLDHRFVGEVAINIEVEQRQDTLERTE